MGRSIKQTVDYFPHYVTESKTKFVLESRWGNDGYAFWFKLLEILCKTDGHYYCLDNPIDWDYFISLMKVKDSVARAIIDKLVELGKIDRELWLKHKIIWCSALIENLEPVYSKRKNALPSIPVVDKNNEISATEIGVSATEIPPNTIAEGVSATEIGVSGNGNQQSKVEYIKVNNKKEKVKREKGETFSPPTLEEVKAYCESRKNNVDPKKFFNHYKANGWYVGKVKMKDWKAAVQKWEADDNNKPKKKPQKETSYDLEEVDENMFKN